MKYSARKSILSTKMLVCTAIILFVLSVVQENRVQAAMTQTTVDTLMKVQKGYIDVTEYTKNGVVDFQKAFDAVLSYGCKEGEYVVVYVPEGTYAIHKRIKLHSYTWLKLDDNAFIRNENRNGVGSMLSNYYDGNSSYQGYEGARNIIVEGGTWDGNLESSSNKYTGGFTNILFAHCENIAIRNLTVKDNYNGHLIEFCGVQNGSVQNCDISGYQGTSLKEALQLDITHTTSWLPAFGSYDDTACNNILIENNRIYDFPRGIGSHMAVKGIYNRNIVIQNNEFDHLSDEGILAYNYENLSVISNSFKNVGLAIEARNRSYCKKESTDMKNPLDQNVDTTPLSNYGLIITSNTIVNLTKTSDMKRSSGIRVLGKEGAKYTGVVIKENKIQTYQDGIYLEHVENATVADNNIIDSYRGIHNQFGLSVAINSNKIRNCRSDGLVSYSGYKLEIKENEIKENKGSGIVLANASNYNTIAKNTISSNKKQGIHIQNGCYDIKIIANTVVDSTINGMRIYNGCNDIAMQKNTIQNSGMQGIYLYNSKNNTITWNTVTKSKKAGIYVNAASNSATIERNRITDSNEYGIRVVSSNKVAAKNNIVNNSVKGIFQVTNSKSCNIKTTKNIGIGTITLKKATVSGTGMKQGTISVQYNNKTYKANIDKKGNFKTSKIKNLKKGKALNITVKLADNNKIFYSQTVK